MIIKNMQQGSEEWLAARCGRITMSHAKELITGGRGITRRNYLIDVAAERLTGRLVERVQTDDMIRGIEMEPFALEAYQLEKGVTVGQVGLAYLDASERISASPDGLMGGSSLGGGVEIKCPRPRQHMRYLNGDHLKHQEQIQGNMWIFGVDTWDFVSFCPEFEQCPLFAYTVPRDEATINKIARAARSAVDEVDEIVEVAAAMEWEYSNLPELLRICTRSMEHLEAVFSDGEVEVET